MKPEALVESTSAYHVIPLSPARRLSVDLLQVAHGKHVVHGLVEVDVTLARRLIQEQAAETGENLSFTGFVIAAVARAVSETPSVNAVRKGRHLIVYENVDVNTMIERNIRGELVVAPYIVRSAHLKTVRQIHDEIRGAQTRPIENPGGMAPAGGTGWIYKIPSPVRRALIRRVGTSPRLAAKFGGIIGVTAVGMFGDGPGWGIPLIPATLSVTVGGIGKRPCLVDGRLTEHEFLCLTLTFDHDIIDGAPAARFSARLKELIEGAYGLPSVERTANRTDTNAA